MAIAERMVKGLMCDVLDCVEIAHCPCLFCGKDLCSNHIGPQGHNLSVDMKSVGLCPEHWNTPVETVCQAIDSGVWNAVWDAFYQRRESIGRHSDGTPIDPDNPEGM